MASEDALILASPERKRILRDLLGRVNTWTAADRILYREMLWHEWHGMARDSRDDEAELAMEKHRFVELVTKGVSVDAARERATKDVREVLPWKKTKGQKERERRKAYREAVTSMSGAEAVTHTKGGECITACIICGKPLGECNPSKTSFTVSGFRFHRAGIPGRRRDSAYCSNACRQKAYRRRLSTDKKRGKR